MSTPGSIASSAFFKGQAGQSWLRVSAGQRAISSRTQSSAIDRKSGRTGKSGKSGKFAEQERSARDLERFNRGVLPENENPVKVFDANLRDGTLTKAIATSCLKTAVRREKYDGGLGEAAIKWLWKEHDSYEFPKDVELLDYMIRLLVQEGKEDLLWSWIEQKSRKSGNLGPKDRFAWRADAVRSLVTSKAFASEDCLDEALQVFLRAKSSTYSIPLAPARTETAKLLMMPASKKAFENNQGPQVEQLRWPNTDLKLWESFFKAIDAREDVSEPFRVQLPLYRPDGPDPQPYLKYSRHLAGHPSLVQKMLKRQSLVPWIARGRHAEAVLKQSGQAEDANWLGAFTKELDSKSEVIRKKRDERRTAQRNGASKKFKEELSDSPS
ncbi:hypothetical protein E4T47_05552 [Aureobasidium subglaciale]|nr:hypothetical protein E4T47_05552 [Aureobasidium subglaciale]